MVLSISSSVSSISNVNPSSGNESVLLLLLYCLIGVVVIVAANRGVGVV